MWGLRTGEANDEVTETALRTAKTVTMFQSFSQHVTAVWNATPEESNGTPP
ncbi:MAG: hypothetical protein ACOYJ6_10735 [Caulobacterales bacterium]|jgi:hypothetical protein